MTAHKLLYYSEQGPDGKFFHRPRKKLEKYYKILIVDEVSMLPSTMWELLLTHRIPVIACGDPGQLPPVAAEDNNHVLDNPHVFLDEIMRQAQDSEIIRLSMHVREGKPLSTFEATGAQVKIFNKNQVSLGMYEWADQILCATNKTRNDINNIVRQSRGYGIEPCQGDKIISLSNHWEFMSNKDGWSLTNGSIGTLDNYYIDHFYAPRFIHEGPIWYMFSTMSFEGDKFEGIPIDYQCLKTGAPALTGIEEYKMRKNGRCSLDPPYDFAYAYAITTHKAQGSEWPRVLVVEESFPYQKDEHIRWLYTACTRASEKLVVIKD